MPLSAAASVALADIAPTPEAGTAAAGSMPVASRGDHAHPRITWSGYQTTSASGIATFDFSAKPFDNQPTAALTYVESSTTTQPVILKITGWTQAGGKYTGCTVQAQRAQTIPTNIVTLLLGGVFNLFAASASGVSVSLVLIPQS